MDASLCIFSNCLMWAQCFRKCGFQGIPQGVQIKYVHFKITSRWNSSPSLLKSTDRERTRGCCLPVPQTKPKSICCLSQLFSCFIPDSWLSHHLPILEKFHPNCMWSFVHKLYYMKHLQCLLAFHPTNIQYFRGEQLASKSSHAMRNDIFWFKIQLCRWLWSVAVLARKERYMTEWQSYQCSLGHLFFLHFF